MAGDTRSKPYSPDDPHEFNFVCRQYPMLRVVYSRRGNGVDTEQYIGFLKTAAGGVFSTKIKDVAEYIRSLDLFKEGVIEEMDHESLGEQLSLSPTEPNAGVVRGAVGTVARQGPAQPEAPAEAPPAQPSSAKGPKRRPVAA